MKKALVVTFAISFQSVVLAQSFQSRITTEVEHFLPDRFMGSVLVTQADETIYSRQFGFSNLDLETEIQENSIFRIASLTKMFTSAAILLLEEDGALSTEDAITTHVQGLPTSFSEVTLLHLLSHTSGIADIPNSAFNSDGSRSLELTETQRSAIVLESRPGQQARYSNTGYHLLGEVVESASGMTYSEFVTQNILEPLQLRQTGFISTIPENLVIGYYPQEELLVKQEIPPANLQGPQSSGGMYSTAADLESWSDALFGAEILSQSSVRKMTTIQNGNQALGFMISNENGRQRFHHPGSIFGFASSFTYFPESDITIIVLSNINGEPGGPDTDAIAKSIEYILFEDDVLFPSQAIEIELPQTVLANYIGEYSIQPQSGFTVSLEVDRLVLQFYGDSYIWNLLPLSETTFHVGYPFIHYEFLQDKDGTYSTVVLHQRGSEFAFIRQ